MILMYISLDLYAKKLGHFYFFVKELMVTSNFFSISAVFDDNSKKSLQKYLVAY